MATSTGHLAFYRLHIPSTGQTPSLSLESLHPVCEPEILVLSLCWHPTAAQILGLTLSSGSVLLVQPNDPSAQLWNPQTTLTTTDLQTHSLEAWMLAFGLPSPAKENPSITILSGGDDMLLQASTLDAETRETTLQWQDRRIHQAGVTAILPLAADLVVTGSYDDHIRLLSIPSATTTTGPRRCRALAEENLEGGVWRLKLLASNTRPAGVEGYTILASCMHAGARVVRLRRERSEDGAEWAFEVLARFEEHESMNYGSDVQPCREVGERTVVSISFYDRRLCLWKV